MIRAISILGLVFLLVGCQKPILPAKGDCLCSSRYAVNGKCYSDLYFSGEYIRVCEIDYKTGNALVSSLLNGFSCKIPMVIKINDLFFLEKTMCPEESTQKKEQNRD